MDRDKPIHSSFIIELYLDTMLLSYLVDNSCDYFSKSIKFLSKLNFVNLITSDFVLVEFIGIRKLEHYIRKAITIDNEKAQGELNYSALFNTKRNSFSVKDSKIIYQDISDHIKSEVKNDINKLFNDFNIRADNVFHRDLFNPTKEICLSSRISKEDSLMVASAILPGNSKSSNNVVVMTNDNQFKLEFKKEPNLNKVFRDFGIKKPDIILMSDLKNPLDGKNNKQYEKYWLEDIVSRLLKYNSNVYLGRTIIPRNPNLPQDCIFFSLIKKKRLNNNIYLTVIGKKLDFMYSINCPIAEFWNNGKIEKYPFYHGQNRYISCMVYDFDDDRQQVAIDQSTLCRIKEKGNYVFMHPD